MNNIAAERGSIQQTVEAVEGAKDRIHIENFWYIDIDSY